MQVNSRVQTPEYSEGGKSSLARTFFRGQVPYPTSNYKNTTLHDPNPDAERASRETHQRAFKFREQGGLLRQRCGGGMLYKGKCRGGKMRKGQEGLAVKPVPMPDPSAGKKWRDIDPGFAIRPEDTPWGGKNYDPGFTIELPEEYKDIDPGFSKNLPGRTYDPGIFLPKTSRRDSTLPGKWGGAYQKGIELRDKAMQMTRDRQLRQTGRATRQQDFNRMQQRTYDENSRNAQRSNWTDYLGEDEASRNSRYYGEDTIPPSYKDILTSEHAKQWYDKANDPTISAEEREMYQNRLDSIDERINNSNK